MAVAETLTLILGSKTLDLTDPDGNGLIVATFDPGAPTVREVSADLPTQDGQYDETAFLSSRVVAITGRASPSALGGFQAALDQLNAFLAPGARPQLVWSTGPDMPERVLTMRASQWSQPYSPGFVNWSAQWKCPDPVAYSRDSQSIDLFPGVAGAGVAVPLVVPMVIPASTSGPALFVTNGGSYQTWPVLRIYGPCTQPIVTWLDPVWNMPTGVQVAFTSGLTIGPGDFLEVDTRARTVYLNGESAASRYSFLDFPNTSWGPLLPGVNLLHFAGTSTDSPTKCTGTWWDAWL